VLGDMVSHAQAGGGTLGFFAFGKGQSGFVSIAQALAPAGAKEGDWIHLTSGRPLPQLSPASRVARLAAFDDAIAFAQLTPETAFEGNRTPSGPLGDVLAEPEIGIVVGKIGAMTGLTTGRLTAFIDRLKIGSGPNGTTVHDLFEVTSGGVFCEPGDGGALVFSYELETMPRPLGIVFATTGYGSTQRAYLLRLPAILERLDLEFAREP
jgi:hypothetical protein